MNALESAPTLSETLRTMLRAVPSVRRLSHQCGIDRAVISRFVRGEHSIDIATADRLCGALGLSLATSAR